MICLGTALGHIRKVCMKITEAPKQDKKVQLEKLLAHGTVMIIVDTRVVGVVLPDEDLDQPQIPINLDYGFQIPDFEVGPDGVQATLEFGPRSCFCKFPYDAIYAMRCDLNDELVIFPEDIPMDIAARMMDDEDAEVVDPRPSEDRPKLVALENEETKAKREDKKDKTRRKKPHLRLVK
jgi:stringent starvation protein B